MTLRAVKLPAMNAAAARPLRLWSSFDTESEPGADAPAQPGFDDGFEAGSRAKEAELGAALDAIGRAQREIEERMNALDSSYRRQCAATLARIISAAAPAICETAAQSAIARIFNDAVGDAPRAELTLTVSQDIHDVIQGARGGDLPAAIAIDADLPPGSLQARWRDGGLDCDVGRSLFAIVEFLNSEAGQTPEER